MTAPKELTIDIRQIAGHILRREAVFERSAINQEARTIELAFASNKPIEHWFGMLCLTMQPQAIRTERLSSGAPVCVNHDWNDQVGVVEKWWLGNDGMARALVRFGRSARAEEIFQDVVDGIRRSVSVGFLIHEIHLEKESENGPTVYRSDDWEPFEISIVSVPADISVGVGRSLNANPAENTNSIQIQENTQMSINQDIAPAGNTAPPAEQAAAASIIASRTSRTRELIEWAAIFGDDAAEVARGILLENPSATVEDIRVALQQRKAQRPQEVKFEPAGHVEISQQTREVVDNCGWGLTRQQLAAISTLEYRDAFVNYLRKSGERDLGRGELRALQEGVDSAGGFLVPADFIARLIERLPAETSVQNYVTKLNTSSDRLVMPRNSYSGSNLYTTGMRVSWVDEVTGVSPSTGAENFGNVSIPVHTAMLAHDVSRNLLEDASFDIMSWLQGKFAETMAVVIDDSIINGSGIGRPYGILSNPGGTNQPAIVVSGNASTLTGDGLIDLAWSLLSRYRNNARFVFNSPSAGRVIAKLKDSNGRYLFASGVTADGLASARPSSLLGFPFIESDFMPDVAANAYPVIFGDLSGYYLVQRVGFSIQVLNEVKAAQNQVQVLGRMRIGGQVVEDWRIKIQKVST